MLGRGRNRLAKTNAFRFPVPLTHGSPLPRPSLPKFGESPDGVAQLRDAIVRGGGPVLDRVHLPAATGVFEKLTSPSKFTGSHKNRFSEDGRGRGKEGRVDEGDALASDAEWGLRAGGRGGTLLSSAHADRTRMLFGGSLSPAKAAEAGQLGRAPLVAAPGAAPGSGAAAPSSSSGGGGGAAFFTGSAAQYTAMLSAAPLPPGGGGGTATASRAADGRVRGAAADAPPTVEIDSAELETIFHAYCAFGTTSRLAQEMDSARFAKLCRENGIVDDPPRKGGVNAAAVDLAFSKALDRARAEERLRNAKSPKPVSERWVKPRRTLRYKDFQQALALLGPLRYPETEMVAALQALVEGIIHTGGPGFNRVALPNVSPIFAKLTDESQYPASTRTRLSEA